MERGYFRHPACHTTGQLAAVQIVPDDLVPTYISNQRGLTPLIHQINHGCHPFRFIRTNFFNQRLSVLICGYINNNP